ncbi:MAG: phenylacetate--CoA ligase family protein [Deltaproteobacteria bacterium]|nr:phenylacetate--CoA ligase family protein [Deltaproteobacteria bacterium]
MLAPATGNYEVDRQRHVQAFAEGLPTEIARVEATRAAQHQLRDQRLSSLLEHAREHSPWHRRRLASLGSAHASFDDLRSIPPMTKAELMHHWDEIVCDRRLSLSLADDHIERIGSHGPAYLLDSYHAAATGGTTGHRGVIVWDFEGFRLCGSRAPAWGRSVTNQLKLAIELPVVAATIGSYSTVHMLGAFTRCFSNPALMQMHPIAASMPIEQIIERLEELQPDILAGYASMLQELALHKLAGRLRIDPAVVQAGGEPFLPEARAAVSKAFPVPVRDTWGSTEVGFGAASFPGTEGLVISEDLVIIEAVDAEGRPVSHGERATKMFVTNLTNRVLPIIRYEITDEVTLLPPDPDCPWKGERLSAIHGRQDEVFVYDGGRKIHPHTFRSPLTQHAAVAEYQVRQTTRGAHVVLVGARDVDIDSLKREIEKALSGAGLEDPVVQIKRAHSIERHARSQKLKRFVPLD